jgi:SAM-dependent methyltransferase
MWGQEGVVFGFGWRKEELRKRFYAPEFCGMYQRFEDTLRERIPAGAVVLDAGCGSGRVFRYELALTSARSCATTRTSTSDCAAIWSAYLSPPPHSTPCWPAT